MSTHIDTIMVQKPLTNLNTNFSKSLEELGAIYIYIYNPRLDAKIWNARKRHAADIVCEVEVVACVEDRTEDDETWNEFL